MDIFMIYRRCVIKKVFKSIRHIIYIMVALLTFSSSTNASLLRNENESECTEITSEEASTEGEIIPEELTESSTNVGYEIEDTQEKESSAEPEEQNTTINSKLLSHEAVVYTYKELSDTLLANNGITTVYLGGDIQLGSENMIIHANKKSLILDGTNPLDMKKKRHKITGETKGTTAIYLATAAGNNDLTIRNMDISIKSNKGFVNVLDSVTGRKVTYENVVFEGPLMDYNKNGTVQYMDCEIVIKSATGGDAATQVANVHHVKIGGDTTITHTPSATSAMFHYWPANGTLTFLAESTVTLNENALFSIFNEGYNYISIEVEPRANVTWNTGASLFEGGGRHTASSFVLQPYAVMLISQKQKITNYRLIRLSGDFVVKEHAQLYIKKLGTGSNSETEMFFFRDAGTKVIFDNPTRVVLEDPDSKIFAWKASTSTELASVEISSKIINYWATGSQDPPMAGATNATYQWYKKDENLPFTLKALGSSTTTIGVTSNYEAGDAGPQPSTSTFNLQKMRVLALGFVSIAVDPISGGDKVITGNTEPYVDITVKYNNGKELVTLTGTADGDGFFSIVVPEDQRAYEEMEVSVTANNSRYISKTVSLVVGPAELAFYKGFKALSFKDTFLTNQYARIRRKEQEWSGQIIAPIGTNWTLSAIVDQPLVSQFGDTLGAGSLVYVDENNVSYPLDQQVRIVEHLQKTGFPYVIKWEPDKGILLNAYLPLISVGRYTTSITWILSDAP